MTDHPPRPKYHDYQPPRLYMAGCTLRRSYLTGRADSVEEGMMKSLLKRVDDPTTTGRSTTAPDASFFFGGIEEPKPRL